MGNCREYSVILAALLKARGSSQGALRVWHLFQPKHYEDHWVVEYWNATEERWQMIDSQLDDLQQKALKIQFNPLDVPAYKFITGAKAWLSAGRDRLTLRLLAFPI